MNDIFHFSILQLFTDGFFLVCRFLLIPSWICPQWALVLGLFLSCLAASSLCSNRRPHPFLPCNSSWIVLGLDTFSSHVLADYIPNSGPANWPCNWTPHCCMSIWVVLVLDSLSLRVAECYTRNSYLAHWPCNRNPPQTTMYWLVILCLLWHPSYFLELI